MLDFGTPTARDVAEMTVDEADAHATDGQFPEGSMGPKMRAATRFVRATGGVSVVTDAEHACASLSGRRRRPGHRHPRRPGRGVRQPVSTATASEPHVIHSLTVHRETYVDSVVQLSGTRALLGVEGVDWASAAMATPHNVATLQGEGFAVDELSGAGANDLFIAVRAGAQEVIDAAREAGEAALFATDRGRGETLSNLGQSPATTLDEALRRQPDSTVAVVSVPGDYAALEAHKALSAGLHVLLFSDNVGVADEIALKDRATDLGLLVMGPGAGTAMLGGTCLGFANVVDPGRVGVVAAAGTGAQEAATLLHRWGIGVSQVIGLGGRDLSARVGGRMALAAIRALAADAGTDAILLVSKPPDVDVARAVLAAAGDTPLIAALIGVPESFEAPAGVTVDAHAGGRRGRRGARDGRQGTRCRGRARRGGAGDAGRAAGGAQARAWAVLRRDPLLRVAGPAGRRPR